MIFPLILLFQQIIMYYFLILKLGKINGGDWYRSINCLFLFLRGLVGILYDVNIKFTALMYMSYCLFDSYQLLINKNNRFELWIHHIYTFFAYRQFYYTFRPNDYFIAHLYLLAESLSICNANWRKNNSKLKKWRLFTILIIRLPIWIYSTYLVYFIGNIDTSILSLILYYLSPVIMIGIDSYLFKKLFLD